MAEENQEENKETPKANSPEAEAQGANKKKKMMMIIIGLVVVLGGGGGAFMALKGDDGAKIEEQAEQSESGEADESASDDGDKSASGEEEGAEGEGKEGEEKAGETTPEAEAEALAKKYGQTYELKPFNLNLGNPLENRYIRLVIAIEFKGGQSQKAEITAKEPKIRDIVVSITTKKTMEFLLGPDGKDHLRHELFVTINQSLENKIEAVYITDMLIE